MKGSPFSSFLVEESSGVPGGVNVLLSGPQLASFLADLRLQGEDGFPLVLQVRELELILHPQIILRPAFDRGFHVEEKVVQNIEDHRVLQTEKAGNHIWLENLSDKSGAT